MLKLMYITNRPEIADILYATGVDRAFVDLEVIGKAERQGGMDTVQSHHTLDDVSNVRYAFNGELLVRSNPIHADSKSEINEIIARGADVVMLPYFKTADEVRRFVEYIGGRAKVDLLIETAEAVENLNEILEVPGIDEVHIGLNDLHLAYRRKFMFELLADGTVEKITGNILSKDIPFGVGGIAAIGQGIIPGEMVIKEHYRIGSSCAILSRAFCNAEKIKDISEIERIFAKGVSAIRSLEKELKDADSLVFATNHERFKTAVEDYIKAL